jgi:hypothetical protein
VSSVATVEGWKVQLCGFFGFSMRKQKKTFLPRLVNPMDGIVRANDRD